ncbi:MAG: V-type ATPase subunit [Clostridia bacterium]|nr:V-type ATPase subunit [Clostridia bacterium]
MISYASNAVLSKARALYGKGIKEKHYSDLLACKSIPDITSYLKRKTNYADVLSGLNENSLHRAELENHLKMKLFIDFETLGRYDISVGEHFFEYIITRAEIEQIMHSLMLLNAGKSGEYIHTIPEFFYSHAKFELKALKYIKNYDEFLNVIKNSKYYKVLLPFKNKKGELLDLTAIETALYNYLYEVVFEIINKYVKGSAKKELTDFFNLYIDLTNLVRIVRMRKFYDLDKDYMFSMLISHGTLSREQLYGFVDSPNDKQMMADMKKTKMGKKWFSRGLDVIDKVPLNMRYNKCKHSIRFSLSPPVVLMSYIFLKEVEILNITNIIEGIKYRIAPEEIRKMLII